MLIYLDACCLNRCFDDQSQYRIRLESEAITLVLERVQRGDWNLLSSTTIEAEMAAIADSERRRHVYGLLSHAMLCLSLNDSIMNRARELEKQGIGSFDALHIACAEAGEADVLLTVDDRLLRVTHRNAGQLKVMVANPLSWLQEVIKDEYDNSDLS